MAIRLYLTEHGNVLMYDGEPLDSEIIVVENCAKWRHLYLINMDGTVSVLDAAIEEIQWIDNVPVPEDVVDYANRNKYYLSRMSLELIVGRYELEKGRYDTIDMAIDYLCD